MTSIVKCAGRCCAARLRRAARRGGGGRCAAAGARRPAGALGPGWAAGAAPAQAQAAACGREARAPHRHTQPRPRQRVAVGAGAMVGAKNRKERRKERERQKEKESRFTPKTWSCNTTHGKNWVLATHASRHAKHAPTGYCPANAIAGISRCDHFLAASSPPSEKGRPSSAWRGRARLGVSRQYGAEPAAARCQVAG